MLLVAPLRNEKLRVAQFPLHLERYDNLFRLTAEPFPYLRYGLRKQVLVALVEFAFILVGEALVNGSVLYVNIINVRVLLVVVIRYGEHVHVVDGVAHHLALRHEVLQQQITFLQPFSLFKLHELRVGHHALVDPFRQFASVTFEHLLGLSYVLKIILPRLLADATPLAVVYMILQTRAVFAHVDAFLCYWLATSPWLECLLNKCQYIIHRGDVWVWSEVSAELLVDVSRLEYSREKLVCHDYGRVGLAILQQDIVLRVVFLYKSVLEQKGILLRVYHGVRDVLYLRDEHLCLEPVHFPVEIARHAPLQVLGLSHIYYLPTVFAQVIIILVAARLLGHIEHYVFQVL